MFNQQVDCCVLEICGMLYAIYPIGAPKTYCVKK